MDHERRIGQETNAKSKSEWDNLTNALAYDPIEQLLFPEQQSDDFNQDPSEL